MNEDLAWGWGYNRTQIRHSRRKYQSVGLPLQGFIFNFSVGGGLEGGTAVHIGGEWRVTQSRHLKIQTLITVLR